MRTMPHASVRVGTPSMVREIQRSEIGQDRAGAIA